MVNKKKTNVIQQIRKLCMEGHGQREIARILHISRNTVARYLGSNPVGTGSPGGPGSSETHFDNDEATHGAAHFDNDEATHGAAHFDNDEATRGAARFDNDEATCGAARPDNDEATRGAARPDNDEATRGAGRHCGPAPVQGGTPPDSRSLCLPHRDFICDELALGLSGRRIYQDLQEEKGFTGSYPSVKRFLRALMKTVQAKPFRRLEKHPGEEIQVDFGKGAPIPCGKCSRRPPVISCILSYSRRIYAEALPGEDMESFIRGIENAFRHFGGVTATMVLDNLKAAVRRPDWFDPDLTPKFKSFCDHYGVCALPCHVRTPRHKGRVERSVDYVQENALKVMCQKSNRNRLFFNIFRGGWKRSRGHGDMVFLKRLSRDNNPP